MPKGFIYIGAVITISLIAMVLGATVYVLVEQSRSHITQCTLEAKLCPDGSAVGRTGPRCEFAPCPQDETANWKTYRNEGYGFEFMYPPNLVIETIEADGDVRALILREEKTSKSRYYWVEVSSKPVASNLDEWFRGNYGDLPPEPARERVTFKDLDALHVGGRNPLAGNRECEHDFIAVMRTGFLYRISAPTCPGEVRSQVVEAINKTFEFITPTLGWKTYRNEQYGFEVKYPPSWAEEDCGSTKTILCVRDARVQRATGPNDQVIAEFKVRISDGSGDQGTPVQINGYAAFMTGWSELINASFWRDVNFVDPKLTVSMIATPGDPPSVVDKILSTFKFTEPTGSSSKLSPEIISGKIGPWAKSEPGKIDVIVRYDPAVVSNEVAVQELESRGAMVLFNSDYFYRVTIRISEAEVFGLADLAWVTTISPIPPPPTTD